MDDILANIQEQARAELLRVTQHAQKEMDDEDITLDEVIEAIIEGQILEDYPEHKRGSCCLVYGRTKKAVPLHIVCTTTQPKLIIITVYKPTLPKWVSPTKRRNL